jgi:hypothetical protein
MTDSTVYRALVDSRRGRDDEGEVEVMISSIERFSVELGDQFLAQRRRGLVGIVTISCCIRTIGVIALASSSEFRVKKSCERLTRNITETF